MCYLCDNNKDLWYHLGDGELVKDEYEGFNLDDGALSCTLEGGQSSAWLFVNYCPICGRKLKEHDKITIDANKEEMNVIL